MYIGNNEINAVYLGSEEIAKIYQGNTVVFEKGGEPEPPLDPTVPLTFEITGNGNIVWFAGNSGFTKTIQYSKNGGAWTNLTPTTGGTNLGVVSGDTVQFRGNNATYYQNYSNYCYCAFRNSTAQFKAKGNIMSLIDSQNYANLTTLSSAYTFYYFFNRCTGLTDASELVLPATTLAFGCYENMFYACTSLTTTPQLPATTLAERCYRSMFAGCTSLTTAPSLPATTAPKFCYSSMFEGCTSLTKAPELPATTLANYCYDNMFQGCTSLTTAPELPATTLANNCYQQMFSNCKSLTTAPELPATTLVQDCYRQMFYGCTSLNNIKCLATDIPANGCTGGWVYGVSGTGTFIGDVNTDWPIGNDGIPEGWATNIPYIVLSTTKIKLTEDGATTTFDMTTSKPWTATTIPSWVSLSQTTGASGTTTITVTATTIPSTEVEDSIIISNTYKTATITVTNITVSITPFGEWYEENLPALEEHTSVNLCQTLYVETSFADNVFLDFSANGETSGENYDIRIHMGNIDIMPDYTVTQSETEIDGNTYKVVDFGEIIKVDDPYAIEDLHRQYQEWYDDRGIHTILLG